MSDIKKLIQKYSAENYSDDIRTLAIAAKRMIAVIDAIEDLMKVSDEAKQRLKLALRHHREANFVE